MSVRMPSDAASAEDPGMEAEYKAIGAKNVVTSEQGARACLQPPRTLASQTLAH